MQIYHLDCSLNDENRSLTRKYSKLVVNQLAFKNYNPKIHYIDLMKANIPFIDKKYEMSMFKPAEMRTPEDWDALNNSFDIQAFVKADVYVLGVPAYFFNVPAVFKNWLEHLFRFDVTITRNWEGMLKNKKMYVVSAWGGTYTNTTIEHTFEQVITQSFNLFGIMDITFFNIYVDKQTSSTNAKMVEEAILTGV